MPCRAKSSKRSIKANPGRGKKKNAQLEKNTPTNSRKTKEKHSLVKAPGSGKSKKLKQNQKRNGTKDSQGRTPSSLGNKSLPGSEGGMSKALFVIGSASIKSSEKTESFLSVNQQSVSSPCHTKSLRSKSLSQSLPQTPKDAAPRKSVSLRSGLRGSKTEAARSPLQGENSPQRAPEPVVEENLTENEGKLLKTDECRPNVSSKASDEEESQKGNSVVTNEVLPNATECSVMQASNMCNPETSPDWTPEWDSNLISDHNTGEHMLVCGISGPDPGSVQDPEIIAGVSDHESVDLSAQNPKSCISGSGTFLETESKITLDSQEEFKVSETEMESVPAVSSDLNKETCATGVDTSLEGSTKACDSAVASLVLSSVSPLKSSEQAHVYASQETVVSDTSCSSFSSSGSEMGFAGSACAAEVTKDTTQDPGGYASDSALDSVPNSGNSTCASEDLKHASSFGSTVSTCKTGQGFRSWDLNLVQTQGQALNCKPGPADLIATSCGSPGSGSTKKKRRRCGACEPCLRKINCGECSCCRNRKTGHQICKLRKCNMLKQKPISSSTEVTNKDKVKPETEKKEKELKADLEKKAFNGSKSEHMEEGIPNGAETHSLKLNITPPLENGLHNQEETMTVLGETKWVDKGHQDFSIHLNGDINRTVAETKNLKVTGEDNKVSFFHDSVEPQKLFAQTFMNGFKPEVDPLTDSAVPLKKVKLEESTDSFKSNQDESSSTHLTNTDNLDAVNTLTTVCYAPSEKQKSHNVVVNSTDCSHQGLQHPDYSYLHNNAENLTQQSNSICFSKKDTGSEESAINVPKSDGCISSLLFQPSLLSFMKNRNLSIEQAIAIEALTQLSATPLENPSETKASDSQVITSSLLQSGSTQNEVQVICSQQSEQQPESQWSLLQHQLPSQPVPSGSLTNTSTSWENSPETSNVCLQDQFPMNTTALQVLLHACSSAALVSDHVNSHHTVENSASKSPNHLHFLQQRINDSVETSQSEPSNSNTTLDLNSSAVFSKRVRNKDEVDVAAQLAQLALIIESSQYCQNGPQHKQPINTTETNLASEETKQTYSQEQNVLQEKTDLLKKPSYQTLSAGKQKPSPQKKAKSTPLKQSFKKKPQVAFQELSNQKKKPQYKLQNIWIQQLNKFSQFLQQDLKSTKIKKLPKTKVQKVLPRKKPHLFLPQTQIQFHKYLPKPTQENIKDLQPELDKPDCLSPNHLKSKTDFPEHSRLQGSIVTNTIPLQPLEANMAVNGSDQNEIPSPGPVLVSEADRTSKRPGENQNASSELTSKCNLSHPVEQVENEMPKEPLEKTSNPQYYENAQMNIPNTVHNGDSTIGQCNAQQNHTVHLSEPLSTNSFETPSSCTTRDPRHVKVETSGAITILSTSNLGAEDTHSEMEPDFTGEGTPTKNTLNSFLESPMKYLDTPTKNLIDTPSKKGQSDFPICDCVEQIIEKDEGPYYTHLGAGPSVAAVREIMESRYGEKGKAIRIEVVIYTGKEGKSSQGCPIAKWEEKLDSNLQNLATDVAPVYEKLAPDAFHNQVEQEHVAPDCRLGLKEGRPFSGVTACIDFCAHAHKDTHNMHNGSTVVCTLTKEDNRSVGAIPEDEQLHVLPLYKISQTDEFGDEAGQEAKIKNGAIQVLSAFPREVRLLAEPVKSSKKKKQDSKRVAADKQNNPDKKQSTPTKSKDGLLNAQSNSPQQLGNRTSSLQKLTAMKMESQEHQNAFKYAGPTSVGSYSLLGNYTPSSSYNLCSVYPFPSIPQPGTPTVSNFQQNFSVPYGYIGYNGNQHYVSSYMKYSNFNMSVNGYTGTLFEDTKSNVQHSFSNSSSADQNHIDSLNRMFENQVVKEQKIPNQLPNSQFSQLSNACNSLEKIFANSKATNVNTNKPNGFHKLHLQKRCLESHQGYVQGSDSNSYKMQSSEIPAPMGNGTLPEEVWSDSEHNFLDEDIGGVAVAPSHGSILIECARRELHATTPIKKPNRNHPTRISLVFYQHKSLNEPKHGLALWEAKMAERAKEREEEAERLGYESGVTKSGNKKGKQAASDNRDELQKDNELIKIPTRKSLTATRDRVITVSSYALTQVTGPYNRWV
nr:PREDICTED: methylcytosine dioxygenase TET1 isoform X2 [Latimeria chalumnae]|eukprot:XP_005990017.1 PREDICTED: methylcytosine dioxygenase TET1 isoform X2 [Latimeria chalumnae]